MLKELFISNVYVKIYKNNFTVKNVDKNIEVVISAIHPFTTTRLLVGEFNNAEKLLKETLKKMFKGQWYAASPIIVIQPMEMIEGGLSPVEERVLRELAFGAGGRKVVVWVGKELSNEEVIEKAKTHNKAPW